MSSSNLREKFETFEGEHLKSLAEASLERLGASERGQDFLERYAFGVAGRVADPRLRTDIADIELENPVMVGAGWDKKGRAIHGLHALGFAGVEVGTVLPFAQVGNPRPRLWTIDRDHSVGLNRLGFNSLGATAVSEKLDAHTPFPCPVGINIGANKEIATDPQKVAWAHTVAMKKMLPFADYITLGISSPNTPGLRGLQNKDSLRLLIQEAHAAMFDERKVVPLFLKIDSERTEAELEDIVQVALEENAQGVVATNTYMGADLKQAYGKRWASEAGGLSGADPQYRARATETVRRIYRRSEGQLTVIGVGGVDSAESALEKIRAGASAVQIVTAIRPSYGRVAARINRGLLDFIHQEDARSITEYIGVDA